MQQPPHQPPPNWIPPPPTSIRLGDADANVLGYQLERIRRKLQGLLVAAWILVGLTFVAVFFLWLIAVYEHQRLL